MWHSGAAERKLDCTIHCPRSRRHPPLLLLPLPLLPLPLLPLPPTAGLKTLWLSCGGRLRGPRRFFWVGMAAGGGRPLWERYLAKVQSAHGSAPFAFASYVCVYFVHAEHMTSWARLQEHEGTTSLIRFHLVPTEGD